MRPTEWINKHLNERRLLYILIFILILTTAADIYTALKTPVFEIAESNPIYVLTGSTTPLFILTLIATAWIIKSLRSSISLAKIFVFVMMAVYLSLGHGFGMWSNLQADADYQQNPEEFVEYAKSMDSVEKIQIYSILIGVVMLLPIVVSIMAFNITMFFYGKRAPKREKIMGQIYGLAQRLYKK